MRLPNVIIGNNRRIYLISSFLFLGIVGLTLLSLASSFGENLLLELFSHFKIQYLVLNLFLFGLLLLISRRILLILISIFCLTISLSEIAPWYIYQSNSGESSIANLRVLSANVNIKNQNYSKVLSFVREEKPDIAAFIETNKHWLKQLNSLKDILPYSLVDTNSYNFGLAIYSKHKIENASIDFSESFKSFSLVGKLTLDGRVISLIATHPPPPKPGLFQFRNKQLGEIGQYIKSLSTPVILVGDLNTTMWSSYYKRFIQTTRLVNARKGFGVLPSWPTTTSYSPYSRLPNFLSWLLSIPIDHCLISPEIKVVNTRTGANVNSDHRPLITDLVISEKKG